MESQQSQKLTVYRPRVADFYQGKSVFITGAAGYLGVILLEILLRCCPGIRCIYILLRGKRGVEPEFRLKSIFKREIFNKLKEKQPDVLQKVRVVSGDISLPNLGMSKEDELEVATEASIVFHCAAIINFLKPLKYILLHNAVGTANVIDFCKKFKKLDALVYTSTAYSNSNRNAEIEEQIYRLPFPSQRFLDVLSNGSDEDLRNLVSQCYPKWPNTYTFSKCLAENILAEQAAEFPVSIIRPSIIVSCWKGALPGYVEEGSGMVALGLGIGKGFVRVMRCDPEKIIHLVPVDIVANCHVVAAWHVATRRTASPFVVNCTSSGEIALCTWGHYANVLLDMSLKHPLPKSYQSPYLSMQKSSVGYWLLSCFEHYIPAIAIDCLLWLSGRKPRLVSLYRYFERAMKSVEFFLLRDFKFRCDNFMNLDCLLDPDDKEVFYTDIKDFTVEALAADIPTGAPFYKWDIDRKRYDDRMRSTYIRHLLTAFIKWFVVSLFFLVLYLIFQSLFQRS